MDIDARPGPAARASVADVWAGLERALDRDALRPWLATDVEVARYPLRDGGAEVVAHNPRTHRYLRLSEAEADLLPWFDGTRSVRDLVAEELRATGDLDVAATSDLVRLLHRDGFLTEPYVDVDAALARALDDRAGSRRARLAEAARTFDVQWQGADRFLRRLHDGPGRWVFSPAGKAITTVVGLGGLLAFGWTTAHHDYSLAPESLGLAVLLLFVLDSIAVFVHESGHALVLLHHGRRVNGAGFRLYFGTPAFYVDSTDALMLGQRARLWQSFAGPWSELVVAALPALVVVARPEGALAPLLWRFCFLSYLGVVLNLLPLLELDGYWILSDALRVRNLRARSLAFVRRDLWWKLRRRQRLTGGEVGLLLYGTAGVAFTVLITLVAVLYWQRLGGGLIERLWSAGPLGVAGLVLLVVVIVGPMVSLVVDGARALGRRGKAVGRRLRFRAERRWRIEAAQLLDQQPIFDDLPVTVLNRLAGTVTLRSVAEGQAVVRQGDPGDAYYLVRRGRFEVIDDAGGGVVQRRLGPEASFGELALVNNAPRNATVRATSPAEVFVVTRSAFERLLLDHAAVDTVTATLQEAQELGALPCFGHLATGELLALAREGAWAQVAPGTAVVVEGEPGDAFYAVGSGRLEVVEAGVVRRTLEAGSSFGELALLNDSPRTATVRAVTPARVFRLGRDGFDALVRRAFSGA